MLIFKKGEKKSKNSSAETMVESPVKEKSRRGFRHNKNETPQGEPLPVQPEKLEDKQYEEAEKEVDALLDIFPEETTDPTPTEQDETEWSKGKKRKTLIPKDMKSKPVYLEDTGEKLGTVFDMIYDGEKHLIGYKIKDEKSKAVLSFPADQFEEDKKGLVFIPGWYTKSAKTIEKLEFKDRISPELTALLSDDAVSNEELYEIFVKHDDEMAKYIEDAISLKEMLSNRLKVLEKQRLALKDNLMDLTEKRLIKDIDRKQFSEDVMEHRRKVNILDVNINKCKELIQRLGQTSFGVLGNNNLVFDSDIKLEGTPYEEDYKDSKEKNILVSDNEIDDAIKQSYKEKYYSLKEQFEQLEDDYQELKMAVEKVFSKDDL
jgi:hypothetical protein